jgi:hypothetical protein
LLELDGLRNDGRKVAVDHVDMNPIGGSTLCSYQPPARTGKIRGEDREGDLDGIASDFRRSLSLPCALAWILRK